MSLLHHSRQLNVLHTNYIHFKLFILNFQQFILTTFYSKPTTAFSARDTSSFFTKFYNSTVLCVAVLFYYFLTTNYPCASGGPFRVCLLVHIVTVICFSMIVVYSFIQQYGSDSVPWCVYFV